MKSNLDKYFKTDADFEKEGVWCEIDSGTAFKLKRIGGANVKGREIFSKIYRPYTMQLQNNTIDEKTANKLMAEGLVMACMVDWRNVEIDGVDTPFSKEVAIELLKDLPELCEVLHKFAQNRDYFALDYKDDLGNS